MRNAVLAEVARLARSDDRIVFVGSDMQQGTRDLLGDLDDRRFLMEGISEQHIIGLAAGLALEGFMPFVSGIATFLTRRALEQIIVDVCLHNLPVRILGSGGGAVYSALGPTHMATDDIGLLAGIPNMTVAVPGTEDEAVALVRSSVSAEGPVYLRLGKTSERSDSEPRSPSMLGRGALLKLPGEVLVVSTGPMSDEALHAAAVLDDEGITAGVLHLHTVKPIDEGMLLSLLPNVRLLVTLEEGTTLGALADAVLRSVTSAGAHHRLDFLRLGLPDRFLSDYGNRSATLLRHGLTAEGVAESIRFSLRRMTAV